MANHFNGLVDPVLIVAGMRRLPRFMAKGTLWKVVAARPFLRLVGLVPVYRARDGDTAGNADSFARVVEVLARDGTVAIFPEGTTHDEPRLAEVRTGAARIAAQAWVEAPELEIVPVGITYEDKVAIRSRVLLRAGPPLRSDAIGRPVTIEDHEAVNDLTERIGEAITSLSPDYASRLEAGGLGRAAEVTLRRGEPAAPSPWPTASAWPAAWPTSTTSRASRSSTRSPATSWAWTWSGCPTPPSTRCRPPGTCSGRLLRIAIPMVPGGALRRGRVLHQHDPRADRGRRRTGGDLSRDQGHRAGAGRDGRVPAHVAGVGGLGRRRRRARGRLRGLAFPLSPVLDAIVDDRSGFWPSLLVFVCCPLFGLAALWLLEHLSGVLRSWADWRAVGNRRGQLPDLLALRAELVDEVAEALHPLADTGSRGPGPSRAPSKRSYRVTSRLINRPKKTTRRAVHLLAGRAADDREDHEDPGVHGRDHPEELA